MNIRKILTIMPVMPIFKFGNLNIYNPYDYFPLSGNSFFVHLLPTGSEERGVLGVGSIPVAIPPSCQYKNYCIIIA